jgi:hypothetical protein
MRKIKKALRLNWGKGMSNRQIATSCGIGRPTGLKDECRCSRYAKFSVHRYGNTQFRSNL